MLSNLSLIVEGLMSGNVQKLLGIEFPAPKLLPLPSRKAIKRGKIIASLENRFPDYEFDSHEPFRNVMVCESCLYTAEHFLCWKNGWRYQIWACGCSDWTAGPWSCPSEYPRFSTQN